MEEWQKQHIQKNLVELVKLTTCSGDILIRLTAKNVLSQDDVEELELPILTPSKKTKRLFDILLTRVGAYGILMETLEETRQTGALKILREHNVVFRSFGSISYDKNHVLGTGSSGTKVFKGKFDGRDVAVKVLNTDLIEPETAIREVNMIKILDDHENIVRCFMAETEDNFIYIALELCAISLQDEVKMNLFDLESKTVLLQCTTGLTHLHRQKIVHGDLKPANILVSHNKKIKLTDFGVSKQIQTERTSVSVRTANVGTLDWMAPEILKPLLEGNQTNAAIKTSTSADIFSLGCVFHFILAKGNHPFGMSTLQRQNNIVQNHPLLNADLDRIWLVVITKMISASAKDRPSAGNILGLLNGIGSRDTTDTSSNFQIASSTSSMLSTQQEVLPTNSLKKPSLTNSEYTLSRNIKITNQTRDTNSVDSNGNNAAFNLLICGGSLKELQQLLEMGVDWKIKNNEGKSLLHLAVEAGNLQIVNHLISLGADIHATDKNGETPLHKVTFSKQNFLELLSVLLYQGALIGATDKYGNNLHLLATIRGRQRHEIEEIEKLWAPYRTMYRDYCTILHFAVERGNLEVVNYFAPHKPYITAINDRGETPLLASVYAKENFKEIVAVLIENGHDVNALDCHQNNLVFKAILRGRIIEDLKYLVQHGVAWDGENYRKQNVLHLAACQGHLEAVKYFISLNADIHARDKYEDTPLLKVAGAKNNFVEILSVLVTVGASINVTNCFGENLLFLATEADKSVKELRAIVNHPWGHRAMLQSKNKNKETVLHVAVKKGNLNAIKYFISLGVSLHERDEFEKTPLLNVCWAEKSLKDILHLLVDAGSDVAAVNFRRENLLFLSAQCGRRRDELEEIVKVGVPWRVKNESNQTLVHVAVKGRNFGAVSYFISLGLDVNAVDSDGHTPLCYINCEGEINDGIYILLRENGAAECLIDQNRNFSRNIMSGLRYVFNRMRSD